MDVFFNPGSIAFVGATKRNIGYFVVKNLLAGFKGPIYLVNPNYKEIEGLTCFPSLDSIPDPVDLVIILVPAPSVPVVLEACARKSIRGVIIESAGFAETGERRSGASGAVCRHRKSGRHACLGPELHGDRRFEPKALLHFHAPGRPR